MYILDNIQTTFFYLPWTIPEENNCQSSITKGSIYHYQAYPYTTFLRGSGFSWNWMVWNYLCLIFGYSAVCLFVCLFFFTAEVDNVLKLLTYYTNVFVLTTKPRCLGSYWETNLTLRCWENHLNFSYSFCIAKCQTESQGNMAF